jgi:hypothetical protein
MKKILVLLILAFGLFLSGCEEPAPLVPDCELYGYGKVTVVNKAGFPFWVDVTYTLTGVNYSKWLYTADSYTYRMDKGIIYIHAFYGSMWAYDDYYLNACEELTYTWYSTNVKKTNTPELYLEISKNGEVIETVTDLQKNINRK